MDKSVSWDILKMKASLTPEQLNLFRLELDKRKTDFTLVIILWIIGFFGFFGIHVFAQKENKFKSTYILLWIIGIIGIAIGFILCFSPLFILGIIIICLSALAPTALLVVHITDGVGIFSNMRNANDRIELEILSEIHAINERESNNSVQETPKEVSSVGKEDEGVKAEQPKEEKE